MAERDTKPESEEVTFETLMTSLERIVERIETGEIGLEESLKEYERGVALIRRGRQILSQVEQRVERLRVEAASEGADLVDDDDQASASGAGRTRKSKNGDPPH